MIIARQSTAFEFSVGPVLDASGAAVTDCVVGDFKIKKTTGNYAALNGSATLTHVSAGTYDLVLTTSDTDTVGLATVSIDDGANACAPVRLQVVEEAVYDALFAASAPGYVANAPVNVAQFGGTNGTFNAGIPAVNTTKIEGGDATDALSAASGGGGGATAEEVADAVLAAAIEAGVSVKQVLSILGAVLGGELSGVGTGTVTFKALNNDGTTRLVAVTDGYGNRTDVTPTLP